MDQFLLLLLWFFLSLSLPFRFEGKLHGRPSSLGDGVRWLLRANRGVGREDRARAFNVSCNNTFLTFKANNIFFFSSLSKNVFVYSRRILSL